MVIKEQSNIKEKFLTIEQKQYIIKKFERYDKYESLAKLNNLNDSHNGAWDKQNFERVDVLARTIKLVKFLYEKKYSKLELFGKYYKEVVN